LPLFVFGHSAGAALVASLLIRNPYLNISGVIFSSALFQFHKSRKIPLKKKIFLKLMANDLEVRPSNFFKTKGIHSERHD
jgi:alpha-beta hydrolase superfamily lysophospholipase